MSSSNLLSSPIPLPPSDIAPSPPTISPTKQPLVTQSSPSLKSSSTSSSSSSSSSTSSSTTSPNVPSIQSVLPPRIVAFYTSKIEPFIPLIQERIEQYSLMIGENAHIKRVLLKVDDAHHRVLIGAGLALVFITWWFGPFIALFVMLSIVLVHLSFHQTRSRERLFASVIESLERREIIINGDKKRCEWLNYMIEKFWSGVVEEIILSIIPGIQHSIDDSLPDAFKKRNKRVLINTKDVTLGHVAPRLNHIDIEPTAEPSRIILKTEIEWVSDEAHFCIEVQGSLVSIPIDVTNFLFRVPARIELNLNPDNLMQSEWSLCFLRQPDFQFSIIPLGVDLMLLPGIPQLIEGIVQSIFNDMFVLPQRFRMTFGGDQIKDPIESRTPITDLKVLFKTDGEVPPEGYSVLLRSTGLGFKADLNGGCGGDAHEIYLCYQQSNSLPPITDIGVYFRNVDSIPPGWERISKTVGGKAADLTRGARGRDIYLCVRRDPLSPPITSIAIEFRGMDKEVTPPGYYSIDRSITHLEEANLNAGTSGNTVYLLYKGGNPPDLHLIEQAITGIEVLFQDRSESPSFGYWPINRTVSGMYEADTNKGAGGRTILIAYQRANLFARGVRVITDVQLVTSAAGGAIPHVDGYTVVERTAGVQVASLNSGSSSKVDLYLAYRDYAIDDILSAPSIEEAAIPEDFSVLSGIGVWYVKEKSLPTGFVPIRQALNDKRTNSANVNNGNRGREMYICQRKTMLRDLLRPYFEYKARNVSNTPTLLSQGSAQNVLGSTPQLALPSTPELSPAEENAFVAIPPTLPPAKAPIVQVGVWAYEHERLPPRWEAVDRTTKGFVADLNSESGGMKLYLAYRRSHTEPPVTNVGVMFRQKTNQTSDGEVPPPGWTEIRRTVADHTNADCNKNSGGKDIYLCYRTDASGPPIVDLHVLFSNRNEVEPNGSYLVQRTISGLFGADLNRGSGKGKTPDVVMIAYTGGLPPFYDATLFRKAIVK